MQVENKSYKGLTSLQKQVVDKMINMSTLKLTELTGSQKAKLDLINEAMKELTPKQRKAVNMLFGLDGYVPSTEREVAKELGISRAAVHQLKLRAINSVRKLVKLNESAIKNIEKS